VVEHRAEYTKFYSILRGSKGSEQIKKKIKGSKKINLALSFLPQDCLKDYDLYQVCLPIVFYQQFFSSSFLTEVTHKGWSFSLLSRYFLSFHIKLYQASISYCRPTGVTFSSRPIPITLYTTLDAEYDQQMAVVSSWLMAFGHICQHRQMMSITGQWPSLVYLIRQRQTYHGHIFELKSRVWDRVPEPSTLMFRDILIFKLQHSVGNRTRFPDRQVGALRSKFESSRNELESGLENYKSGDRVKWHHASCI